MDEIICYRFRNMLRLTHVAPLSHPPPLVDTLLVCLMLGIISDKCPLKLHVRPFVVRRCYNCHSTKWQFNNFYHQGGALIFSFKSNLILTNLILVYNMLTPNPENTNNNQQLMQQFAKK